jgi:23S rRNA (cytidine1920-2'-O)/16S rRNA (cytidine1409-2'-O)-methyltransferase
LAPSRAHAHDLIARGAVLVGGAPADKPARLVAESDAIVVNDRSRRFVSRGGDKLEAALDRFPIVVAGRRALDAGASTGGFTDSLLQRQAASVTAVDVGYGQLHPRLRQDPRVEVRERTNIRTLAEPGAVAPFELIVADLSFISLTTVVPVLAGPVAVPGADLVLLVKPQFEVGRVEVSRGRGVVRDPELRRLALDKVGSALGAAQATIMGVMASPVLGPAGNAEYLLWARTGPPPASAVAPIDVEAAFTAAVAASPDAPAGEPTGDDRPPGDDQAEEH